GDLNLISDGVEKTYVYLDQSNQIASSALLGFYGSPTSSSRLNLRGHAQTVAGISNSDGRGLIQNTEFESDISNNGVLTINNSADYSFNGYLRDRYQGTSTGVVAIVKTGAGTQTLSGANIKYTGGTTVSGGTLVLKDTVDETFLTKYIMNNATLEFNTNTVDLNYSGVVSGSGGLTKTGAEKLTLSGSSGNTYTGTTTISAGILRLNKTSSLAIGGNLNLTSNGSVNNYVYLDQSNQIASSAMLTFYATPTTSSRFNLLGHTQTVAGLSCSTGRGVIQNTEDESGVSTNGVLTVNNTVDCSYDGFMRDRYQAGSTGKFALIKMGAGTLTLAGSNITHTGGTTVGGGTLSVIANTIASSVTVNSGGTFAPGVHDLHEVTTGAAAWNNGGEYLWEINDADGTAGTNWDVWNVTGNLSIASTFTINVDTLNGTSAGSMADFNNQLSYSWLLAETTGSISGFANLALDTSGFQNALDPEGYLYLSQSGDSKQLFLNYSPTGGDGSMPPSLPGDADGNSQVDESDAAILAAHWGQSGDWTKGDFNGDGTINALDASILAANWGDHNPLESAVGVPEPGVFTLLAAMAMIGLLHRRRAA
ncbi:MAG TPA: autotransporter-associated beta strand repeat-containing protein, partial [Thermoguttaceae bacterium]|nr:autotransporter-associated beta strand repeat-containing protein [Thermoguttaceae bacterium]